MGTQLLQHIDLESSTGCFPAWYTINTAIKAQERSKEQGLGSTSEYSSAPQRTSEHSKTTNRTPKPPFSPIAVLYLAHRLDSTLFPGKKFADPHHHPQTGSIPAPKKGGVCHHSLITTMGSGLSWRQSASAPIWEHSYTWGHVCPQATRGNSQES